MGFDDIVTVEGADLDYLRSMLDGATSVRVVIDGGVKVSANSGVWTPPLGLLPKDEPRNQACTCGHTAYWHGHRGLGRCDDCPCEEFTAVTA